MRLIVDTQGARLRKDGGRLVVKQEGEVVQSVPLAPLRQVILMGSGVSATTPLMCDLVRRGVDVIYQSQNERFSFRLVGPVAKHSALRVSQIQTASNPNLALPYARSMACGKLHNQAVVLRRHRDAMGDNGPRYVQAIQKQMLRAGEAVSIDSLRGYEGSGAAVYFAAWRGLFDAARWDFRGRAYHPPPDPVNALLSFGYTLLLNDITSAVYRIGLDPTIGFYHTVDYGRASLALDLEEEFRPVIVDTLVLSLLRQRVLEPEDFMPAENAGSKVIMTDDTRRFFIARYEERLGVRVRHPALEKQLTYRQCIERQAEHLARCIMGREDGYSPLLIR